MTSPMQFPIFLCMQTIPLSLLPPHLTLPCTLKFKCTLVHFIFLDQHPAHFQSLNWFTSGGTTRSRVRLPLARSTLFANSPFFSSYSTWLQLPPSVRQAPDMPKFRTLVRQHFSILDIPAGAQLTRRMHRV